MVKGLGVDIEEVDRFGRLIKNKHFLSRVYTPLEIAYCRSKKNKAQHFAVRFAAKEAVWKALSDTIAQNKTAMGHKDIGLENMPSGKPVVILSGALRRYSKRVRVSLSHTSRTVVAVAIFE